MNASPNNSSWNLTSFLPHYGCTIHFGKERLPAKFSCKNSTVNAQAYNLISDTSGTFGMKGMALQAMQTDIMMLSVAVDVISQINQADSRINQSQRTELQEKGEGLWRSSYRIEGGPFRQAGSFHSLHIRAMVPDLHVLHEYDTCKYSKGDAYAKSSEQRENKRFRIPVW